MEELEAKLVAGPDVVVPDLAAALPGASADGPEERTLLARYLDSDDLRLARAGATLRHREGEWQVKLPLGAVDASTLRRAELRFPGAEDAPPAEALAAVAALLGRAALRPVATVRTVRRRSLLRRDGQIVAEVCDDAVEAAGAGGEPVRWRELEVEAGPGGGLAEVAALVSALEVAGAKPATAGPKVLAVLGEPAHRPPAHAAPRRDPAAGDLAAALGHAHADLVAGDVAYRTGGQAGELATALASLRALATVAGDAGAADATRALVIPLAALEPDVRELADRQAAVAWLAGVDVPSHPRVDEALAAWQAGAAARASAGLDAARYRETVEALRTARVEAPRRLDVDAAALLRPLRVRGRSLTRLDVTHPARASGTAEVAAAVDLLAGLDGDGEVAGRRREQAREARAALDEARRAVLLAATLADLAEGEGDPAVAFAARAGSLRADRWARTALRRVRRAWLRLDAGALSELRRAAADAALTVAAEHR